MSLRPIRLLAAGLALLVPIAASALGKPEWARPYLALPSPSGSYIAGEDLWVVVFCGIEVGAQGEAIRTTTRMVLENRSGTEQPFEMALGYDESHEDLTDLALNVERTLWHSINLQRKASKASIEGGVQLVFAGAEGIAAGNRVVFEYTSTDKLTFNPWRTIDIPGPYPIAKLVVTVDRAAAGTIRLLLVRPEDEPVPAGFEHGEDGSWTITQVPASGRLTTAGLVYQPDWHSLFPYVMAVLPTARAQSFDAYAQHYGEAWAERLAAIDGSAVGERARALTSGREATLDKVRALARFVQRDVLYDASNQRSLDSWLPLSTSETLRSMKADCKGKVMLLQALLGAIGVRSAPVLLRAGADWSGWGEQVGTARFNHVVLAVDLGADGQLPARLTEGPGAGWVLFDPTVESAAFGAAMPGFEGRPGLFIGKGAQAAFTVRTAQPSAARTRVALSATVRNDHHLALVATVEDNGRAPLPSTLAGPLAEEDVRRVVGHEINGFAGDVRLESVKVTPGCDAENGVTELAIRAVAPNPLQELASSRVLPTPTALAAMLAGLPNGFHPRAPARPGETVTLSPPWNARRNASGRHEVVDFDIELVLPVGLAWQPPAERRESRPWVEWRSSWAATGPGRWRGEVHLEIPRGTWPAAERGARLKLMDELLSSLYTPLLVKNGT